MMAAIADTGIDARGRMSVLSLRLPNSNQEDAGSANINPKRCRGRSNPGVGN
jgi:hypothetical protein